jgi:hypothetical protein
MLGDVALEMGTFVLVVIIIPAAMLGAWNLWWRR